MSFGQHFQYQKQMQTLPEGDYDVTLEEPFETTVGGYAVLRFPFLVDGQTEPCNPNYFDLFDCTDPSNQTKWQMFCRKASRIKECFLLSGDFSNENYRSWTKHKGRVRVEKSPEGFTNVTRFYRNVNFQSWAQSQGIR